MLAIVIQIQIQIQSEFCVNETTFFLQLSAEVVQREKNIA